MVVVTVSGEGDIFMEEEEEEDHITVIEVTSAIEEKVCGCVLV